MPLVVPGMMSNNSGDKTSDWMNKLVGKKIGDSSNETVSPLHNECLLDRSLMLLQDLREDGAAEAAQSCQGGRHDYHGPQSGQVNEVKPCDKVVAHSEPG